MMATEQARAEMHDVAEVSGKKRKRFIPLGKDQFSSIS